MIEHDRDRAAWLLEYREEIAALERFYAKYRPRPHEQVALAPEDVIERFGPELTIIAHTARGLYRHSTQLNFPDSPTGMYVQGQGSGAIDALEAGLGLRLGLSTTHASWLAGALVGMDISIPPTPDTHDQ
ncbi:hypothetical protein [Amycolatopsis minnesotensis]